MKKEMDKVITMKENRVKEQEVGEIAIGENSGDYIKIV